MVPIGTIEIQRIQSAGWYTGYGAVRPELLVLVYPISTQGYVAVVGDIQPLQLAIQVIVIEAVYGAAFGVGTIIYATPHAIGADFPVPVTPWGPRR